MAAVMSGKRGWSRRASGVALLVASLFAVTLNVSAASGATDGATVVVKPPKGAATPVAATGIGTQAALDNPRCNTDDPDNVYGRFDSTTLGGGPICVKPWKAGADNGGATHQGVAADKVTVVLVVPLATTSAGINTATGQRGTWADEINDFLQPAMEFYETWGRDIEVIVFTSTGSDEAAQRADAVTIQALKPFAVLDMVNTGLDVLDTTLAKAKIPVWGYSATAPEAIAQAPYRWGSNDAQASMIGAAEVIGKQLLGKKAEFGGDDVKDKKRVIGAVYLDGTIDISTFEDELAKYGGKVARAGSYTGTGSPLGDAVTAAPFAPSIVGQLKAAGVTTVALFSDRAMNGELMKEASVQEWFPEWFWTSAFFSDLAGLNRTFDQEQLAHAFGLSTLQPWLPAELRSTGVSAADWYWGKGTGATEGRVAISALGQWFLPGVHTAGPNLTPKTFAQGLFSIPATGGAATGSVLVFTTGYGKTVGLPYNQYMVTGSDYAVIWYDPETVGRDSTGTSGAGVNWFVNGGQRYIAGSVPKKQFNWFSEDGALFEFATYPGVQPVASPPCTTCPSATGTPKPGATDPELVVGKAGGTGFASTAS